MLIQALTDEFQRYFAQADHHDTVLWFDPEKEYSALLDDLTGLRMWRYHDSLLQIRHSLIHRAPGQRVVVYLPLPRDEAEVLRPFFATSLIFHERLYRFLRRQGLDFPDDPQVAHDLRALLPRLAARSAGKGRGFWAYNLANLERARETLLGNFDDTLLAFLDRPRSVLGELKREQLDGLFFAQMESAYGLAATPEEDPDETARRLAARLILTGAYRQAQINLREQELEPPAFPYPERLAEPMYHERCWSFVTRWQHDRRYSPAYVRLADALQVHYDLTHWVLSLPRFLGLTLRATFANVQQALWEAVQQALAQLESEDEWRTWLDRYSGPIEARAQGFWVRQGRDPGWQLLGLARDLLVASQGLRRELDHWARPTDALNAYARNWHSIDQDYRRLREALDAYPHPHDRLRDRCARSYREILGRMNERFGLLLEAEGSWPPGEGLPPQDSFWAEVIAARKPDQRIAVLFVDALRYELAQELWAGLETEGAGDRRQLDARLAAIPTTTPIGMSALLPGGDRRQVNYDEDWQVFIEGSANLKEKRHRQAWLEQHLPGIAFYNLDRLLDTPAEQIPEAPAFGVFDTTLDAVGENASTLAWNTFGALLGAVKKGVHKLLGLGVEQVHVVADHGFLLLQEVSQHEKARVRDAAVLATKSRYAIGPHLGPTDQLRFPVPGSENTSQLVAWFPRGIGCFYTPGPYNYVHGGLSLQELIVPHLQVVQRVRGRPVGVQVELPMVIRSAQFKLQLNPIAADMFDQPRQVTLSLEKEGTPVVPVLSSVVRPGEPAPVDVFLPMGCGLEPGDRVRWTLRDAVTGEVLAEQKAVSQVDLW